MCPVGMTYAAVPALRHAPELARTYAGLLASSRYDTRRLPATAKRGVTAGMSMTERQDGSVRANSTGAVRDGRYRLIGHKWFTARPGKSTDQRGRIARPTGKASRPSGKRRA